MFVVNPKKEPPKIEVVVAMEEEEVTEIFNIRSCVWKLIRHLCENDKKYPKFSGWMVLLKQATASAPPKQTIATYLHH